MVSTGRRCLWLLLLFGLLLPAAAPGAADSPKKALDQLTKALAKNDSDEAKKLVDQIVAIGDKEAAKGLFERALSQKLDIEPEAYEVLVKGLASMTKEECLKYYAEQLAGKQIPARVLAVEVAARMTGENGISLIVAGLKDTEISVTEASLEATLKRKPKEAIPVLIDLVETWMKRKVKEAVFYNIKDTLIQLTGESMESVEDWRKWWNVNQATFDPAKIEQGKRTQRRTLGDKGDPQFFGVPISSKNAAFVIDISGSMWIVQKDDIPGLVHSDGKDRAQVEQPKEKMTPENERLAKYWTRIEMAKRQLIQVLKGLKPPTRFNVLGFNDRVMSFGEKSQVIAPATQKKAMGWVKNLKADGNTCTLDALKKAFASDPKLNTIYFLSDGLPSKDGRTEDDRKAILDEILKMNRFRKIKIHTFGFHPFSIAGMPNEPLQKANEFLKDMAQKTGGTFNAMKVDPNEKPPADFH
jgi:hypothetical protein